MAGYVYIFRTQTSGYIKVGYSTNPQKRLKQLERWPGELRIVLIIEGSLDLEKAIHNRLRSICGSDRPSMIKPDGRRRRTAPTWESEWYFSHYCDDAVQLTLSLTTKTPICLEDY